MVGVGVRVVRQGDLRLAEVALALLARAAIPRTPQQEPQEPTAVWQVFLRGRGHKMLISVAVAALALVQQELLRVAALLVGQRHLAAAAGALVRGNRQRLRMAMVEREALVAFLSLMLRREVFRVATLLLVFVGVAALVAMPPQQRPKQDLTAASPVAAQAAVEHPSRAVMQAPVAQAATAS
jgi:hypothetical protein